MEYKNLHALANLLNTKIEANVPIDGASVDSRTIEPGQVYVALQGERFDGHQFLGEAAAKGAAGAIVSKHYEGPSYNLSLLAVEEPLHALQEWARQTLVRRHTRVVAVTGSIGKTTTKDFITKLLQQKYRVGASPGNSNSQVGVPLAILNHTNGQEEILVLEMGMTHPGHIARLVQIAPPEVALITAIALVHACNFESLEEIAWAKSEIFSHPATRLHIFPSEAAHYEALSRSRSGHKLTFSTQIKESDYYINSEHPYVIRAYKEETLVAGVGPLHTPGKHNWHNLLAAVAAARHFHLSWDEIRFAIPSLRLPEKRLQFVTRQEILFVNDSYNASEISVRAALEALPKAENGGNKIAVLGSMMELGKFSVECHARVGEFALQHVDSVYCLGEECRPIYEAFKQAGKQAELFFERAPLIECLRAVLKPSDVVLLKGSRSKELWKVLESF